MKISSAIKKIPASILAWFTLLFLFQQVSVCASLTDRGFLGSLLYLILVLIAPVALVVLIIWVNPEKKAFYRTWWFWLIGAIAATAIISVTYEPAEANGPSDPTGETAITTAWTEPASEAAPTTELTEPTTESTEAPTHPAPETTATTAPATETVPKETIPAEKKAFISDFCAASGYSSACAETVYDFLSGDLMCKGIRFYQKNTVGDFNWDINTDEFLLMVTADEDGIYRAICGDYVLHENNETLLTYEDLLLRRVGDNRVYYAAMAEMIVEQNLKAPSTAEFQNSADFLMVRNGDLVAVQGYVDSQNSFGAMIRNNFIVQFRVLDLENLSYTLTYIQIGDESGGEYIDME